jgi:hypothetical protein
VEGFISAGVKYAQGDYAIENIKQYVTSGQWALVVVTDNEAIIGALTIEFFNRPNDRVAFVTATGGANIINEEGMTGLTRLVKMFGATCIEAAARKSMVRLLSRNGFNEKYSIVGVKI